MLNDAITFLVFTSILLFLILLYVFYKSGFSVSEFKKYWVYSEGGKPVWKKILRILGIPILVGFLLFGFNKVVKADEFKYFQYAKVFVGVDYSSRPSPFCETAGYSDRATSNMGFVQNIFVYGNVHFNGKGTHHSCVMNPDSENSYDVVGVNFEWFIY